MSDTLGYRGYIIDLDGTTYLGDQPIRGAAEAIAELRARGARVAFVSNNPRQRREAYARKLRGMGIAASADDVVNSAAVMAFWLREQAPGASVYVVGEPPLIEELKQAGFDVRDTGPGADFVVLAFDTTFTYDKLKQAHDAVLAGARLVATNPDRACPMPGGELLPDCAAIIGAVEGATGRRVEVVVGKPSPIMLRAALSRLNLPAEHCLMVGDRLETDVAMGRAAGMDTALVLTGVTTRKMLRESDLAPTYVVESIAQVPALRRKR